MEPIYKLRQLIIGFATVVYVDVLFRYVVYMRTEGTSCVHRFRHHNRGGEEGGSSGSWDFNLQFHDCLAPLANKSSAIPIRSAVGSLNKLS